MKYSVKIILIYAGFSIFAAQALCEQGMSHEPTMSATLYNRAPDVLPGTLPEMRTTTYWIDRMKKPDEIIIPVSKYVTFI